MDMKSNWSEPDLSQAIATLKNGGLLLYPTDTIWGIGGDATQSGVVEKILKLKQRPAEKGMLVLIRESEDDMKSEGVMGKAVKLMRASVKPLTVIIPGTEIPELAANLLAPDGSIGIRIPKDDFCLELLRRFGKPVISTSANISGRAAPKTFHKIPPVLIRGVDYVVWWRRDDPQPGQPSGIVRITKDGEIERIR